MEEADVKEKANWKTTPEIKTEFFDNYETHLWEYVHRDILHSMEKRLTDVADIHHTINTSRIRRLVLRVGRRFGQGTGRGRSWSQRWDGLLLKESISRVREVFKEPVKNSHWNRTMSQQLSFVVKSVSTPDLWSVVMTPDVLSRPMTPYLWPHDPRILTRIWIKHIHLWPLTSCMHAYSSWPYNGHPYSM